MTVFIPFGGGRTYRLLSCFFPVWMMNVLYGDARALLYCTPPRFYIRYLGENMLQWGCPIFFFISTAAHRRKRGVLPREKKMTNTIFWGNCCFHPRHLFSLKQHIFLHEHAVSIFTHHPIFTQSSRGCWWLLTWKHAICALLHSLNGKYFQKVAFVKKFNSLAIYSNISSENLFTP